MNTIYHPEKFETLSLGIKNPLYYTQGGMQSRKKEAGSG